MDTVPLTAQARTADVKPNQIRVSGSVPCVLYGNNTEHKQFQCVYNEIAKAFQQAGESTIVEIDTGSGKVPALFHAVDTDPASGRIIHVDFYAVDMNKEVEAHIPLSYDGVSPAVENGGVLLTPHDHVLVYCLPANLPHELTVSLEKLVEYGDVLHVSDIVAPQGVEILDEADTVIATVQEPRAEEAEDSTSTEGSEGAAESSEGGKEGSSGGDGEGQANE